MIADSFLDVIHELRSTLAEIGLDNIATWVRSAPHDAAIEETLQEKLVTLLQKVTEEDMLPYDVTFDSSSSSEVENTSNQDQNEAMDGAPLYVTDESIYAPVDYIDDTASESDHDAKTEDIVGTSIEPGDVEFSKSFFNELFPTKKVTPKVSLPGSFPDLEEFEGGVEYIASGFSGLVFKSKLRGMSVVLKASKRKSEQANRDDYHEWSVNERLNPHPNVLQVIGLCPSFEHSQHGNAGTTAIISPWQENGALRTFYDNREPMENDLQNCALGMIRGIRSLHEQGVVHRDIAVRNFLVDVDGRVMLCDFGLTEFLPEGKECLDGVGVSERVQLPWRYLAPESFDGKFSPASDIWMYGISLIELVTGERPWNAFKWPSDLKRALKAKDVTLPNMEDFPQIIADIVRDCLQFEPSSRPTANAVAERLVRWQFREFDLNRDENGNTVIHQLVSREDWKSYDKLEELLASNRPVMINALNHLGETPLMLAKNWFSRKRLLEYREVPLSNEEPSRMMECFHNIDLFAALLKLAEKEDVHMIKSIGEHSSTLVKRIAEEVSAQKGGSRIRSDTALHIAAKIGNVVLFDALLDLRVFDIWKANAYGRTALHVSSLHGRAELIQKLIDLEETSEENEHVKSVRINMQDRMGNSALHLATMSGSLSSTRLLLNHSATNVNLRDGNGRSPIFSVVSTANTDASAQVEVFQALVHHPDVDINAKDSRNETVLHQIARNDLVQCAQILFERADLNLCEPERDNWYTPVHLAVLEQSFRVAGMLLARDDLDVNQVDKHGNTVLHILASLSILRDVNSDEDAPSNLMILISFARTLVLREDIDLNLPNKRGDTPLFVAIQSNNRFVADILLSESNGKVIIDPPNKENKTALHLAAESNMASVANFILSQCDVDVNARYKSRQTPLHSASKKNADEVATLLLARSDVDPNARDGDQHTPLHLASEENAVKVATILLSRSDVDASARDHYQRTPLHQASVENAVKVAAMLLSRSDVDPNARDEVQQTPLHLASRKNAAEIAAMLLSRSDVDASARDESQRTPLHWASLNAVHVAAMLLSRSDVDASARDEYQRTPLHWASLHNAQVARMLLLRSDVDASARDTYGKTALDIATEHNSKECAELLRRATSTSMPEI